MEYLGMKNTSCRGVVVVVVAVVVVSSAVDVVVVSDLLGAGV